MTAEATSTVAAAFISCRLDYCNSLLYSLLDTLLYKLQSVQNATAWLITGTRRDHITPVLRKLHWLPIGSVSSSKWHVWFASRCPGRRLSTWQIIAASCQTALGALCGQLMFWLAWCREHSAVTATELLQPLDLACGTLFRSSCTIQTSPTDCSDDSWRDTYFGKHRSSSLWLLICGTLEEHLLTYLH